jgi:DUF4097 and DUF4098 domain-containing protein YvlB
MAGAPPPYPPPYPPSGYDPRNQRRYDRDQQRAAYRAQRDQMRAQQQIFRYQMRGLRRGSILAPCLLIAVGVVFLLLQSGRLPRQLFWEWYGHWWPLLLVAAGGVLLAEWAFDQYQLRDPNQPPYRRAIGGGIVFLVIVFSLTGVFAHGFGSRSLQDPLVLNGFNLSPDSFDEMFGDKHESDQSLDFALPSGASLTVVNPHGDVTVSGTSDDNRMHVAIHKQVFSRTDTEADTKARQLVPSSATSGSALTLTMPSLDGARADLILTIPAAAVVSVNANHGDIHVASIKAAVTVTANHGDIELSAITGPATVHINNRGSSISAHSMGSSVAISGRADDVTLAGITGAVSINGDFYGTTHLEHVANTIHFHTSRTDFQLARLDGQLEVTRSDLSADQALGPIVLTTSHNNVTLDRIAGDISVTNHNGAIDLTAAPALGNITLEDRNGSIKVVMPDRAGFSFQADTTNGEIDTGLPSSTTTTQGDTSRGNSNRDSHKIVTGSIAPGGPSLHITTTNGDISLAKATVAPLPATPPAPPKLTLAPAAPPHATHTSKSQD